MTDHDSDTSNLELRFHALASRWHRETMFLSSSSAIRDHPAYQAIIAMGRPVLPLILHELDRRPAHWFSALEAITGETTAGVSPGDMAGMARYWIEWGRSAGYMPSGGRAG